MYGNRIKYPIFCGKICEPLKLYKDGKHRTKFIILFCVLDINIINTLIDFPQKNVTVN